MSYRMRRPPTFVKGQLAFSRVRSYASPKRAARGREYGMPARGGKRMPTKVASDDKILSIRLDPQEYELLLELARREERTISAQVRHMIRPSLERIREEPPRK